MILEWTLNELWMNFEWTLNKLLNEFWMNFEWTLNEFWMNFEWTLNPGIFGFPESLYSDRAENRWVPRFTCLWLPTSQIRCCSDKLVPGRVQHRPAFAPGPRTMLREHQWDLTWIEPSNRREWTIWCHLFGLLEMGAPISVSISSIWDSRKKLEIKCGVGFRSAMIASGKTKRFWGSVTVSWSAEAIVNILIIVR